MDSLKLSVDDWGADPFDNSYPDDDYEESSSGSDTDHCHKSESEDEPADPLHLNNTRHLEARLDPNNLFSTVKDTLALWKSRGINLPLFLDAVSWGDEACISDPQVRYARTALMVSDELPGIMDRWHRPPRSSTHFGRRAKSGSSRMKDFAQKCVNDMIETEMKATAYDFTSPPHVLSKETLTSFDVNALKVSVKQRAPTLWHLLRRAAHDKKWRHQHVHKDPDTVSLLSVLNF